jgi:8-oxo-dGTP diphosphatase
MINCTFEDGNMASLRHLTLTAIVCQGNKILLVKRAPHLLEGDKWCFPGGYMNRDETMAEGVLRELKEETGYEGKVLQLFQIIDSPNRPKEDRQNVDVTFLVEVGEKTTEPDSEVDQVQWFNLDDLPPSDTIAFDHGERIQIFLDSLNGRAISVLTI